MNKWPPDYDRSYLPPPSSIYWDEQSETMDPAKREQEIIIPKLQSQLAYAYEHSPFYKKKWDQAGIKPKDIWQQKTAPRLVARRIIKDWLVKKGQPGTP